MEPKCEQYWPEELGVSVVYGQIRVEMVGEKKSVDYVVRDLAVSFVHTHT